MQVKLLNVLCFLLALVVPAVFADEAKLITKDGVVYSYAVRTKTLRPATVVISTSYYTTVEVREITLSNNKVTSTTEQITTEATITTSLSAVISNAGSSSDFTTTSAAIQDLSNTLSTSVPQVSSTTTIFSIPATESHNVSIGSTQSTRTLSTSQVNTDILSQTTTESHNMSIENIQSTRTLSPSQVTTSVVPKTTTLSASTNSSYSRIPTTMTSISQARNTSNSQGILTTSVNSADRVCYVYYEDDEYYSTFYITAPSQTIDAASTITSTRTKTIYQTISS